MDYIIITDNQLLFFNQASKENESGSIIYKDNQGFFHTIDLEVCAVNFKKEHANSVGTCVGERNSIELYYIFYTSGIKTKLVFQNKFIFRGGLRGTRAKRFLNFQQAFSQSKYTTYDLT